jgi:hypothetical protein
MRNLINALALLALSLPCAPEALAQSRQPEPVKSIGTCVAIQTKATTTETPVALRAEGSCATTDGGPSTCTAEIVPSGADTILDVNDVNAIPQCVALSSAGSCAALQNGPVVFQSQRHATQLYNTGGYAARMTVMIHQIRLQHTTTDQPPGARFPLNVGRMFDVLRSRDAVAVRLECTMADGDPRIFPIVGDADLSPNIRFVSKNSSEPAFEILTYRVVP